MNTLKLTMFTGTAMLAIPMRTPTEVPVSYCDGDLRLTLTPDEARDVLALLGAGEPAAPPRTIKPAATTKEKPAPAAPVQAAPAQPNGSAKNPAVEAAALKPAPAPAVAKAPAPAPAPTPQHKPDANEDWGMPGGATDFPPEVLTAVKVRPVLDFFHQRGYHTKAALIAVCKEYKEQLPVLQAIPDLDERIGRACEVLQIG